jgi:hypothetical protein
MRRNYSVTFLVGAGRFVCSGGAFFWLFAGAVKREREETGENMENLASDLRGAPDIRLYQTGNQPQCQCEATGWEPSHRIRRKPEMF